MSFTYAAYSESTALEAAITSSDTSIEVTDIPVGITAGDRVKVAIEGSPGELVYGVVGTIGNGTNNGTDIDLSAAEDGRGKEGTTAASFSSGTTVVVGVFSRDDAEAAAIPSTYAASSVRTTPPTIYYYGAYYGDGSGTGQFSANSVFINSYFFTERFELVEFGLEITAAAGTGGVTTLEWVAAAPDGLPGERLYTTTIDPTSTGFKTVSPALECPAGRYFGFLFHDGGWDTYPEYRQVSMTHGLYDGGPQFDPRNVSFDQSSTQADYSSQALNNLRRGIPAFVINTQKVI